MSYIEIKLNCGWLLQRFVFMEWHVETLMSMDNVCFKVAFVKQPTFYIQRKVL